MSIIDEMSKNLQLKSEDFKRVQSDAQEMYAKYREREERAVNSILPASNQAPANPWILATQVLSRNNVNINDFLGEVQNDDALINELLSDPESFIKTSAYFSIVERMVSKNIEPYVPTAEYQSNDIYIPTPIDDEPSTASTCKMLRDYVDGTEVNDFNYLLNADEVENTLANVNLTSTTLESSLNPSSFTTTINPSLNARLNPAFNASMNPAIVENSHNKANIISVLAISPRGDASTTQVSSKLGAEQRPSTPAFTKISKRKIHSPRKEMSLIRKANRKAQQDLFSTTTNVVDTKGTTDLYPATEIPKSEMPKQDSMSIASSSNIVEDDDFKSAASPRALNEESNNDVSDGFLKHRGTPPRSSHKRKSNANEFNNDQKRIHTYGTASRGKSSRHVDDDDDAVSTKSNLSEKNIAAFNREHGEIEYDTHSKTMAWKQSIEQNQSYGTILAQHKPLVSMSDIISGSDESQSPKFSNRAASKKQALDKIKSVSEKSSSKKSNSPSKKIISPANKIAAIAKKIIAASKTMSSPSKKLVTASTNISSPSKKIVAASKNISSPSKKIRSPSKSSHSKKITQGIDAVSNKDLETDSESESSSDDEVNSADDEVASMKSYAEDEVASRYAEDEVADEEVTSRKSDAEDEVADEEVASKKSYADDEVADDEVADEEVASRKSEEVASRKSYVEDDVASKVSSVESNRSHNSNKSKKSSTSPASAKQSQTSQNQLTKQSPEHISEKPQTEIISNPTTEFTTKVSAVSPTRQSQTVEMSDQSMKRKNEEPEEINKRPRYGLNLHRGRRVGNKADVDPDVAILYGMLEVEEVVERPRVTELEVTDVFENQFEDFENRVFDEEEHLRAKHEIEAALEQAAAYLPEVNEFNTLGKFLYNHNKSTDCKYDSLRGLGMPKRFLPYIEHFLDNDDADRAFFKLSIICNYLYRVYHMNNLRVTFKID